MVIWYRGVNYFNLSGNLYSSLGLRGTQYRYGLFSYLELYKMAKANTKEVEQLYLLLTEDDYWRKRWLSTSDSNKQFIKKNKQDMMNYLEKQDNGDKNDGSKTAPLQSVEKV